MNTVETAWQGAKKGWNPLAALKEAKETPWLVDGVIPRDSIIWVVGAPACGKTFTVLDLATCVSSGRPWHGRQCDAATVVYVAAEGGTDIHVRRAAAELAAGVAGDMLIVQARPMLAEREGLAGLMSLVQAATGGGIKFAQVEKAWDEVYTNFKRYLTKDELAKFDAMARFEELTDREELTDAERKELASLGKTLAPWTCELDMECWATERVAEKLPADLAAAYHGSMSYEKGTLSKKVLLVIDTYSQTAADDTKTIVGQYIKNLRDIIEEAQAAGGTLSIVVLDHYTKSGESFMGAQAKQGDSDAMIEVARRGDHVTVSCPDKMRAAKPFDPIHLALVPFVLEDYPDTQGRPLTSLIVEDGVAGAQNKTADTLLRLLADAGGSVSRDELRSRFVAHPSNEGKNAESAKRVFRRALKDLCTDSTVTVLDGVVQYAIQG